MYWVIKISDPLGNEGLASAKRAYEEDGEIHLSSEVAVCVFSEESRARRYMLKTGEAGLYGPNVAWVAPLNMDWFKRVGWKEWDLTVLNADARPDVMSNDVYLSAREFASKLYSLRFDGGHVIITPPAEKLMQSYGIDPYQLLERHYSGDWGDQSDEDKKAWDRALEKGFSLMSVYKVGGEEVWLMTDVERLATTFLSPEEYY
ncbi:MAG: hypothetical protein M3N45_15725 [Actinomycetota bacterium]|nr:hypothetical protein [Actinomycetota bacterium]